MLIHRKGFPTRLLPRHFTQQCMLKGKKTVGAEDGEGQPPAARGGGPPPIARGRGNGSEQCELTRARGMALEQSER